MAFKLPDLSYDYNALESYIDAKTMEIHHSKHHGGYTDKLNNAISGTDMENLSIEALLRDISKYSEAVRNNGGGFYNHDLFWKFMSPYGGGQPSGELHEAINESFGSFDDFRKLFSTAAATRFGSGWAWLIKTDSGLVVTSTPNQDNTLMDITVLLTPSPCLIFPLHGILSGNYRSRFSVYLLRNNLFAIIHL